MVHITKQVVPAEQNTDSLFQMMQHYILHERAQFWSRLRPPLPRFVKGLALNENS